MKKWLFLLLLLCPLLAQARIFGLARHSALHTAQRNAAISSVRVTQGKVLPSAAASTVRQPVDFSTMSRLIQRQVVASTVRELPYANPHASSIVGREGKVRYDQALEHFATLREELSPLLYYQSKPSERRELPPAEKRELVDKIQKMAYELGSLDAYILPTDGALQLARAYVQGAQDIIAPELGKIVFAKPAARTDREFVASEFFLQDPKTNFVSRLWRAVPLSSLPPLRVAVVNDRDEVLTALRQEHYRDRFLPNGQLFVFDNAENLLQEVRSGSLQVDMVLTDLFMPRAGGYYVVESLRKAGFEGPVFALSAFQEEEEVGREMFNYGLDGLMAEPVGFENSPGWPFRITRKIANYLYYKEQHAWPH